MRQLKVLHVYKTAFPESMGGVEVFIDNLCRTTASYGLSHTVLCLSKTPQSGPLEQVGYQVFQAKQNFFIASTGFSFSAFSLFKQLSADADIIHYHFPNPFADLLHLSLSSRRPTVLTYHSDIIKQKTLLKLYQPLMHYFLSSMNTIVATSPNYVATSPTLKRYISKVQMIPIGIPDPSLAPLDPERLGYWRARLPQPFFLFIGAMRYYKGLHYLLEAVKGTSLQLVLGGINGMEDELKAYAKEHQLNNVHFVGFLTEADKFVLLSLCYGFVFPSHLRSEAFGISLLEAAAMGKPLISCEIGTGTSYINQHNLTGRVVEPASSIGLREAMNDLLACPDSALRFGQEARQRYESTFTQTQQAEAYLRLYQSLYVAD